MKEIDKEISDMDEEDAIIQMEKYMKVNGKMIRYGLLLTFSLKLYIFSKFYLTIIIK